MAEEEDANKLVKVVIGLAILIVLGLVIWFVFHRPATAADLPPMVGGC